MCSEIYIFLTYIFLFPAVSLPPSQPDVTDYNERSMTLRWRAPIDDGGMKITAYNIEAKTAGGGVMMTRGSWCRVTQLIQIQKPLLSSVFVSLSTVFEWNKFGSNVKSI